MKLRDFLYIHRIVHHEFATKLGLTGASFGHMLCGRQKCGKSVAILIEKLTQEIDPQNYVSREEVISEYKRREL